MELDNKKNLLIIDYFTKYPLLFQMASTIVSAVVSHLTEFIALMGMPLEIFTDNGQHHKSKEWYTYTYKYGFKQTTSSMDYTQSSSFIEWHVSTTKKKTQQGLSLQNSCAASKDKTGTDTNWP